MAFTRMQRAMCKEPFAKNHLQRTVNKRPFAEDYLQVTNTRYTNQSKRPVTKTVTQDRPPEITHGQLKDRLSKVSHERALKGEHHTLPLVQPSKHALQHMPFNTCPSERVLQNLSFKTCSSKHAFHLTPVPRQQKTDLVFHLGWRS